MTPLCQKPKDVFFCSLLPCCIANFYLPCCQLTPLSLTLLPFPVSPMQQRSVLWDPFSLDMFACICPGSINLCSFPAPASNLPRSFYANPLSLPVFVTLPGLASSANVITVLFTCTSRLLINKASPHADLHCSIGHLPAAPWHVALP